MGPQPQDMRVLAPDDGPVEEMFNENQGNPTVVINEEEKCDPLSASIVQHQQIVVRGLPDENSNDNYSLDVAP